MTNRLVSMKEIADELNLLLETLTPAQRKLAILGFSAQSMDGVPLMSREEFRARAAEIEEELRKEGTL